MKWEDEGYINSKRKFRENAIILDVFTNKFGKVSGIVYGGNSRKIKNYLQLSNKIFIIYKSKNENKIGYFTTELIKPIAPKFFNDKDKILCLNSITTMLKSLLPENQSYSKLYIALDNLLNNFNEKNWLTRYVLWEIDLINMLGFGFEIDPQFHNDELNNKFQNFQIDNTNYKIPNFIISKKTHNIQFDELRIGLNFSRSIIENKFFNPNNLRFPNSRILLEKGF